MSGVGRPLALAALVVLAGCGGFASEQGGTPTATVTPAPVPTTGPTPTSTPQRIAPGVTGDGVAPFALAGAHDDRLRNVAFRLLHSRTVVANGSVRHRQVTSGEFRAGYRRYRVVVENSGPAGANSRVVYEYDGRQVTRERSSGNASTSWVVMDSPSDGAPPADPVAALPFDPTFGIRIGRVLSSAGTVRVDPQAPRNLFADKLSLVRASDFPSGTPEQGVQNASFRALVDPDGLVRLYQLRYETVRNGTHVTVVERLRYTIVDETGEPTATSTPSP